jgi:hypothetical protein
MTQQRKWGLAAFQNSQLVALDVDFHHADGRRCLEKFVKADERNHLMVGPVRLRERRSTAILAGDGCDVMPLPLAFDNALRWSSKMLWSPCSCQRATFCSRLR